LLLFLLTSACEWKRSDPASTYHDVELSFAAGNLAAARAQAQQAQAEYSHRDSHWAAKFRLLEAEIMAYQGLSHDALSVLRVQLPADAADPDLAITTHMLQALALSHLGNSAEADANLKSAMQMCSSWQCESSGKLAQIAGAIAIERNQLEEAEHYFDLSREIAERRSDPLLECTALLNLGVVSLGRERFDEAVEWSARAQSAAQKINANLAEEKASGNRGWAYYKMGDFDQALAYFSATVQKAHQLGAVKDETIWLNNLGLVYFEKNQPLRAASYYHQSLQLAQKNQNLDLAVASLNALAFLHASTGQLQNATDYDEQALQLARRLGDHSAELYALLVKGQIAAAATRSGDAETIFHQVVTDPASDTSLRWEAQNSLAKLYESEDRLAAAGKEYQVALATVEHARSAIQHEDFRLPFLANAAHLYDDYIHFLVTNGRTAEALQAADYSRAQTLQEGLGLRHHTDEIGSLHRVNVHQIAKRTRSTILFYWLGPQHSYLWALNSEQSAFFELPASHDIEQMVVAYNRILMGPRDPLEVGMAEGSKLYDVLVRPAANLIRPDSRLIVIPDASLNTLNFETLILPGAKPHYWIEDVTLLTAASLRLLPISGEHGIRKNNLLLMGNPTNASADFEQLPNAKVEIEKIEAHFPPAERQVYVGAQATPDTYLNSKPERFSLIHFVAHGTASTTSPLDSSVVLSKNNGDDGPYKLYARDVVAHPLHADLVTISSCYGAGTRFYTGEGLIGLSWSFLRAGARNVIGALWAVSDTSTPAFMDDFYDQLTRGQPPDVALRTAKLHMLHSGGVFRKPFYWAPFQLYTGS
jgi:CHAT domain-containing protein